MTTLKKTTMPWAKCLWALLITVAPAASQDNDAAKADLKRLQGTWTMHAMEVNGMNVAPNRLESALLTIRGERYEVKVKDRVMSTVVVTLNPNKNPKEMDMTPVDGAGKDKAHKAIYKIEGDTFIFCRGLNPDQERPNQFATWPDTNYFVVTWKKLR